MPLITINNTPIDFPDTAQSPDWSEAIIQFAQEVEIALSGVGVLTAGAKSLGAVVLSPATSTDISLDSAAVVWAKLNYWLTFLVTGGTAQYQSGEMIFSYDGSNFNNISGYVLGNTALEVYFEDSTNLIMVRNNGVPIDSSSIKYVIEKV